MDYLCQDFYTLSKTFDIITATSLLSVIEDKEQALKKLISLQKSENSTLIIIEPTEKFTRKNVKKKITNFKSFWQYKGLWVWARARENKAIDPKIFDGLEGFDIEKRFFLDEMVVVWYIHLPF